MRRTRKKEQEKKKELKEDLFVQFVTSAWAKTSSVRVYVVAAVIAVLVGVIVAGWLREQKQTVKDKGWAALSRLEKRIGEMEASTEEERTAREDAWLAGLGKVIRETEGSTAQPVAILYHVEALLKKGGEENVKKAEQQCRLFLQSFPDNYYALAVKQLLGKALFEQEKHARALEVFENVYDTFLADKAVEMQPVRYEAWYYIGRCQEVLGRTEEARTTFEELAAEETRAPLWAGMARFRLSKMDS